MRLLLLFATLAISLYLTEGVTLVCYFSSWATYRPGDGKFTVEDNDVSLCTHLVYAFSGLGSNNKIRPLDPYNDLCEDYGKCGFDRFTNLTNLNPKLKTTLGIGGWNEGSTKYSNMAKSASSRKTFVDSVIELLKKHKFDGLDMDWEYPTQRGGSPDDYTNYISLMSELYTALHAEGMILTAAVSAGKATIDPAYNIPELSKNIDLIHLMTYDLHGSWEDFTHHHSILYAHPDDTGDILYLNQDFAVNYWLEKGAPKEKLVMGLPIYGRTFRLKDGTDTGMYATSTGPGARGPITRENGYLGYNEICDYMKTESTWTIVHDKDMNEPYAYNLAHENIWVGYEDVDSIAIKTQYSMDKGLAGAMVWSVETDDFHGKCGEGKFPILTSIMETLTSGEYTRPPTLPPTTWDPFRTSPDPAAHCKQAGPNPDPSDCTHYWFCNKGEAGWEEYERDCDAGTLFSPVALICDWKDNVCATGICPNDCP